MSFPVTNRCACTGEHPEVSVCEVHACAQMFQPLQCMPAQRIHERFILLGIRVL